MVSTSLVLSLLGGNIGFGQSAPPPSWGQGASLWPRQQQPQPTPLFPVTHKEELPPPLIPPPPSSEEHRTEEYLHTKGKEYEQERGEEFKGPPWGDQDQQGGSVYVRDQRGEC